MAALLHKFQETVNLGVLDYSKMLYIRVMESPQVFRLAANAEMGGPLHSTARSNKTSALSTRISGYQSRRERPTLFHSLMVRL